MSYLVTGATGFIGRFLVPELLRRGEDVHVLVRAGSEDKLARQVARWAGAERVKPVTGDLNQDRLGIDPGWLVDHRGSIDHMFHLAAIYDLTASDEMNERLNNGGTRHAVEVANVLEVGCFDHMSSVAAAGQYEGTFTEDMLDEGQEFKSPYYRTKFESEQIVRKGCERPWRVYRPSAVVGHSVTGEMDKIDGPYYFFKLLRTLGRLPGRMPFPMPDMGSTNLVPVDYVARAVDHIAHQPGLDGHAFHLVNPEPQNNIEVINVFAELAGAPRMIQALPKSAFTISMHVPGVQSMLMPRAGVPAEVLEHAEFTCRFDSARAQAALAGTKIAVPPLAEYAPVLWKYWRDNLAD